MDRTGTVVRSIGADATLKGNATVDYRSAAQIGRQARLELRFGVRRGRTELVHAYAEPPFRIGRTFAEGHGVHMILASSAPGIFGGDRFTQEIMIEEGAVVRLTSQSALQVHPPSDGDEATMESSYQIQGNASLTCLWDPLIPFAGSRLSQRISVDVAESGTLLWSDAFMAGRDARNERWQFTSFAYELQLKRASRLAYLERYRIQPAALPVTARWAANEASYFGSIITCGTGADSDLDEAQQRLNATREVRASIDRLEKGLTLVRMMSASGAAFHRVRRDVVS